MKRALHSCWHLYREVVHQTLFYSIVAHEAPWMMLLVLNATTRAVQEHGSMIMLALATVFGIVSRVLEARQPPVTGEPPPAARAEEPRPADETADRGRSAPQKSKDGVRGHPSKATGPSPGNLPHARQARDERGRFTACPKNRTR